MQTSKQLLIVLILFSALFTGCYTSLKNGFKLLESGQYAPAQEQFFQAKENKKSIPSANYGIALLMLKVGEDMSSLIESFKLIEESRKLALNLSAGRRKAFRNKEWLPVNNNQFIKEWQDSVLSYIQREEDLLVLDSAIIFISADRSRKFKGKKKEAFERLRKVIVEKTLKYADDYARLHSLSTRHRHVIAQNSFLFADDLDSKLLNAFLNEYGWDQLSQFVLENPNHYVSIDCWVEEFVSAAKNPSIVGMLDFLNDYPMSILNRLAIWKVQSFSEPYKSEMTAFQRQQLESIKQGNAILEKASNDFLLDTIFNNKVKAYVEKCAPATRAYHLMRNVLQKYLEKKQWALAEDLLASTKAYFPDEQPESCDTYFYYYKTKQSWYEVATPIIQRPSEDIKVRALTNINTLYGEEFSPVISSDGETLYFAGSGRKDNINGSSEDVFVSTWYQDHWTTPKIVDSLAGEANFVPLSITNDGNTLLVFVDGKLQISKKKKEGWSTPTLLPETINAFPWIGRAVFADNGRVLIMSASKELIEIDGKSNTDIYVSILDEYGKWEPPFSIGDSINTDGQERSPFIHSDGKTLYFSSNSHQGLGGMDVYKSIRKDNSWKNWATPVNMGKEINTLSDDWGYNYTITTNGKIAYLSSLGERGSLDLFASGLPSFGRPQKKIITLKFRVDYKENYALPFIARDSTGRIVGKAMAKPDGSVEMVVPSDVEFTLESPSKDNLVFPIKPIMDSTKDVVILRDTIKVLSKSDIDKEKLNLELTRIYFQKDSFNLDTKAIADIEASYYSLKSLTPNIEIAGYTDSDGKESYNSELSKNRAESVKTAFLDLGYPFEKIRAVGYGEKEEEASESERVKERRRMVKIILLGREE